ncbi:MAG: multidrug resistance efflux pump [Polaribacter sp.]|jgi:multidrug resistance efflux pump
MEEEQNINEQNQEENFIEIRSEEVQEILGTPPSWMVRWGTTIAFGVLLVLIFVAWLIKYPEIKEARLVLTTSIPPSPIVARVDGNIEKVFVEEGGAVSMGQLLAVMQSTADFDDVLMLEEELDGLSLLDESNIREYQPDRTLILGSLQPGYATLLENFETYDQGESTDFVQESVVRLVREKNNILASINVEENRLADIYLELENSKLNQERFKKLYMNRTVSLQDLEKAQAAILKIRERISNVKAAILVEKRKIISKDTEIAQVRNTKEVSSGGNFIKLREEVLRLQSAIDSWKQSFLMYSPVNGQVAFNGLIKENQFIKSGKTLLRVIPAEEDKEWIGRVELPTFGSGKVEEGQRVVVKFDNYSFEEYGVVEGTVKNKSLLPSGDTYYLEVDFPKGLRTSYKKNIPYKPEMQGSAEIITDNKRFLTWVFDKLISRFKSY